MFCLAVHAGDAPTQPIMLPMDQLLKRLDQTQEWMFVPLADYRALMATITTKEPEVPGLLGARIATAQISGSLADDRILSLTGTLVIDAQGTGPHRCRIFGTTPLRLGAITTNGQPAVLVESGNVVDLLMPGPGRHQVTLSWGIDLHGDDQRRAAGLPLPYAGAVALTIDAATPGSFTGGNLVADPARAGRWRLTGGAAVTVPLTWEPGRIGADAQTVFGVEQMVQASIIDGPASLRWVARLINRRGLVPERLEVILPQGWRLTQAASPGVLSIAEQADGHMRLTLAPGTTEVACDGLRAMGAPLALPQVVGAVYQGGVIMIGGVVAIDFQAPATWRRLEDADGWWRYAVPAPGIAASPLPADHRWGMDVQSSASVELTDGRRPWTMVQSITLADHGGDLGEIGLQLPSGWSLSAFSADQPVRIRQLAGGGEVADLPAGSLVTLVPQAVHLRTLKLMLTLTRTLETLAGSEVNADVMPVVIIGGLRASHRLSLLSTAPIDTRITAGVPWRMAGGETNAKGLPSGALRADLLATGAPTSVQVTVSRLVPEVGAEAVLYLAPGLGDDHWCRIDLRLSVRSGEVELLRLVSPLLNDARVQVLSPAVTRDNVETDLHLRARVPLIGDHLLRVEGALDARKLGSLARLTLTLGDDLVVPLRQVVVVQAPPQADLALNAGPAALALAVDALPAWSRPLPGIPVSAAWRLASGGDTGGYRLERRELASAPIGFIDQVVARSQIDPSGTLTLLTARVAAPGVQALPLLVPRGVNLMQATIDGQEVAVRRVANGGYELPLPGRTQVQVALLFGGGAVGNDLRLPLPRLGDLPATASAWTIAVAGGWRAQVVEDPAAMPLIATGQTVVRPWFGSWQETPIEHHVPVLPPVRIQPATGDARALTTVVTEPPKTGEPHLVLRGHLFTGTRLGGDAEARLQLTALSTLRGWDHLGRVLAVLLAVLLTWRCGVALRVSIAVAALLIAGALHEWQLAVGPLLALAEWQAPALLAVGVVGALVRLRPASRVAAPLTAMLALTFNLTAGEATPVLMGYHKLDPAGVPQEVKVALTRVQLTELYRRAQGDAPSPAVCDLATGTPRFALRFVDGRLLGTMSLAVAVPGTTWQQVRIPVAAGSVRGVSARALGGTDPGTVAWSGAADGAVVLTLAPRQQADVVFELDIPMRKIGDEWLTNIPLPGMSGGSLVLDAPRDLVPWSDDRVLTAIADRWTQELPVGTPHLTLNMRRPLATVARDLRLGVEQRVRVQTHHDRLEWSAVLICTAQGGTLRRLALTVPEGLALTTIDGEGVADWSQRGAQAEIIAASERSGTWTIRLAGVLTISAGAAQERPVLLQIAGADRVSGRLDLVGGSGLRFDRPTGERIERVDPQQGADQAVRWNSDPGPLAVRWRAVDDELSANVRALLVVGSDRVRVHAALDLTGPGKRDALRLRIPAPWEVVGVPTGTKLVWREVAGQRECTLRTDKPWTAGVVPEIRLEAERRALGATISAPDLRPLDGSISTVRQVWLFAGAGDRRVRLDDHERQQAMGVDAARGVLGNLARLGAGERWLQACSWRGDGSPRLTLAADDTVVRLSASHYLVLGQDRVRWSAHLVHQAEQGELTTLRCTLPAAARLVRVNAEGLGTWALNGRELTVTLAAPTRAVIPLDLELEIPLTGDAVTIDGLVLPGSTAPQDVALVEEDDLGLVHLDAQGLDAITDRAAPFVLPVGIDAAAVRHRWRSLRPQWSLAVRREALATTAGIDNVVTLVDIVSVLGVDGECRGRGVWQVLNRTRTHLTVNLPTGVELWEARVAGVDVRPRRGANAGDVVIPVTPQRPGEAAQAITLTWRERVDPHRTFSPNLPRFTDLKIMQGLWRVVPPPGYVVKRRDGTVQEVDTIVVEACRAQSVIDELKRLRTLGDLDDVGLKRLNDQLVTLDLQLSDNLVSLQQVDSQIRQNGEQAKSAEQMVYNSRVIGEVNGNRSDLQRELKRIDSVRTARGERRGKLGLDNATQSWASSAPAPVQAGTYAARPALRLADRKPQRLAPDASLGAGQPPPGNRVEDQRALLGLDLLGDPGAGGLTLRGQTNDLRVELAMTRTDGDLTPWLLLLGSSLALIGGAWFARRR